MTITLDNSISGVNFNGSAVTEVQWNGIKVWPVTPPTPLGEFEVRMTFLNGLTSSITFDSGVLPRDVIRDNQNVAKIEVGSGITELGWDCFRYNSNLSSVTLGESVSLIQQCSFGEAYSLSEISCYASDAPTLGSGSWGGVFKNASANGTLYVPYGSDYSSWVDRNSATSGMKLASGWTISYIMPTLGVFEYTQTISDGDDILIVSTDLDGTAYVLGHNGTTLLNDEVEINDGKINGNHLDSGSVWSATSYNTGFILSNNGYNLYINASNSYTIQFSDYLRSVFYCSNNQLQTNIGSGQRWITYEDDTFKVRNYGTYVYFFRKVNT